MLQYKLSHMSRLHDMMEEIEGQRRRGNFHGAENLAKLEMKEYELEKNTPYYNFYRGLLWYLYGFFHEAIMYFDSALLTEDKDMYFVHKFRGAASLESRNYGRAKAYFEAALATADDPADVVSAMNALGNTYLRMGMPGRAMELYRDALDIALEADLDGLAETALVNIGVAHVNAGDYEGSIRHFEDAMELAKAIGDDRGMRICLNNLGGAFNNMGRHKEARPAMRRARELDPLLAVHQALSSQVAFCGREYSEAVQFARQAIVVDPEFWIGHLQLAQALEQLGQSEQALEALTSAGRFSGGNSKVVALRGYIFAKLGRAGEAREVLRTLVAIARERYVPPYAMALVHAGLGEGDDAFEWLDRAFEAHDVHLVFLPIDPKWDGLRADPRFAALLKRAGLPIPAPSATAL